MTKQMQGKWFASIATAQQTACLLSLCYLIWHMQSISSIISA